MKKLMIAAALAACGAMNGFPLESANIVGYQTQGIASANFTAITVPFAHVNNDGKGLMLNSNDVNIDGLYGDPDGNIEKSDQIWIWDPTAGGVGAYVRFYYDVGWDDPDEGWDAGWMNSQSKYFEEVYKNGLPEGGVLYYKAQAGVKSITGSGAVEGKDEVEVDLAASNFTATGNPYPVATQLNGEDAVTINGKYGDPDGNIEKSDQIWIWDPTAGGVGAYVRFYYDVGWDDPDEGWDAGWMNAQSKYFEEVYKNGLPAGQALYYKALTGKKSIVFTSPLSK